MKKILLFVLPALVTIVSCQKELSDPSVTAGTGGTGGTNTTGGTGGASITGTWKFISLSAVTKSTNQFSVAGLTYKSVTTSDYTSFNNAGTVVITSNSVNSNGIAYDIADTAFALTYENNVLISNIDQPFSFSLPPYTAVAPYKQINQDSIYFAGPGLDPSTSGTGAHLSLSGNILKMTSSVVKDTTINAGGYLAQQHSTATTVTTLQKQ